MKYWNKYILGSSIRLLPVTGCVKPVGGGEGIIGSVGGQRVGGQCGRGGPSSRMNFEDKQIIGSSVYCPTSTARPRISSVAVHLFVST